MKRLSSFLFVFSILMTLGFPAGAAGYLGVATEPIHPEVGEHLQLPRGAGITVRYIDPDSPAAEIFEPKDVLYKFDDQILIDPRQLAVLVRSRQPGEKVAIALYRRGEEIEKTVALGEREMPKPQHMQPGKPQAWPMMPGGGAIDNLQREMEQRWEQFRNSFGTIDEMIEDLNSRMGGARDPNANVRSHSSVSVSSIQNGMRFNYSSANGDQHLEVIDSDGKVIFDGPINTEEELDQLPPEAAEFLDSIDVDIDYEPEQEVELIPSDAI